MKGYYLLLMRLERDKSIPVGGLGTVNFKRGNYIYVGSAMVGYSRVMRHFKRKKKRRWHIDYFLEHVKITGIIFLEGKKGDEVKVARRLMDVFEFIPGFGAGDSPLKSHLFYTDKSFRELNIWDFLV